MTFLYYTTEQIKEEYRGDLSCLVGSSNGEVVLDYTEGDITDIKKALIAVGIEVLRVYQGIGHSFREMAELIVAPKGVATGSEFRNPFTYIPMLEDEVLL